MTGQAELQSWCNSCGRTTDHRVTHSDSKELYDAGDSAAEERTLVIQCLGCKEPAIRREIWHFDRTPDPSNAGGQIVNEQYQPPRRWWRVPEWLDRLDPDLRDIIAEVYSATNDDQFRLLAMGVRTTLDYVMVKIVGDVGSFEEKLNAMVAAGHLSSKQSEMLATVIDAASAAAHRGFKPNRELLKEMMAATESVIRDHYLTSPMLKQMKTLVPPRPPRKRP